jgi:hypothetical protein
VSTFQDLLTADRRLVLLRLLADLPGRKGNSSVLASLLDRWGHSVSRDYVKTQIAWLAEQGLVTAEDLGPVVLATITERGIEAVEDRVRVPGVSRPGR